MPSKRGRHFLQLPGPSTVPDRILEALRRPVIDHRGPEFQTLGHSVLRGMKDVFQTHESVFIFPGSGSGGWEAALVNTLSPGDAVLVFDQGFFAGKWAAVARSFGLDVRMEPWDLRKGVSPEALESALAADKQKAVKAVLIVHNETSTGVTTDISVLRPVLDALDHPALLMVDAVSSLGSVEFRHDQWGLDVSISGSQKGLMLPPGLSFTAVSERARLQASQASLPRSYWDWDAMAGFNERGFFPYTPATNLLFGLREAIAMLQEEGLLEVFERHRRFGAATRNAASAWGLDIVPMVAGEASNVATTMIVPDGQDAEALRAELLERFDLSVGKGLGSLAGTTFRIGHLGDLNALTLIGTLAGVEMGLNLSFPGDFQGGVVAAMNELQGISFEGREL